MDQINTSVTTNRRYVESLLDTLQQRYTNKPRIYTTCESVVCTLRGIEQEQSVYRLATEALSSDEEKFESSVMMKCTLACCHLVLTVVLAPELTGCTTEPSVKQDLVELETTLSNVLGSLDAILNVLQRKPQSAVIGMLIDLSDSAQFQKMKRDVLGAIGSRVIGYTALLKDNESKIDMISSQLFLTSLALGEQIYHSSIGTDMSMGHSFGVLGFLPPTDADFVIRVARAVEVASKSKYGLTIEVSRCGIDKLPDYWLELIGGEVRRLAIWHNPILMVPQTLQLCYHLRYLNLRNAKLAEFPQCILSLPQLEVLDLSKNRLHDVPAEIVGLKALGILAIQWNQITHLPLELGFMSELQALQWHDNPLIQPPHSLFEYVFRPIAQLQVRLESEVMAVDRRNAALDDMREKQLMVRLLKAFLLKLALKRKGNRELIDGLYNHSSRLYLCTRCGTVQVQGSGDEQGTNVLYGIDMMHAVQVVGEGEYNLFRDEVVKQVRQKVGGEQDRPVGEMYKMEQYSMSASDKIHCED